MLLITECSVLMAGGQLLIAASQDLASAPAAFLHIFPGQANVPPRCTAMRPHEVLG